MKAKKNSSERKKLFLLFLSAFAVIFFLLSLIMVQLIRSSSFVQVDNNIKQTMSNPNLLNIELEQSSKKNPFAPPTKPNHNAFNTEIILWTEDGVMINSSLMGNRLSELENLSLNKNILDKITTVSLSNEFNSEKLVFRSLMIKAEDNADQVAYIQILSNINQVQTVVKQSQLIIIICMIIFWLISIIISYYLSRLNMKPILKAWNKQQEFVANASHELRTPLTIISLNLEKLFTRPNHTILEESEIIAEALNETKRLSLLTTDLLMLAKSDSNSLMIYKQPVDIAAFIDDITKPFELIAHEDQKEFNVVCSDELVIPIDREKIHQVLLILIDNALKYTQPGDQIYLLSNQYKKNWMITVENNGKHINPESMEKIFQRFYQDPQHISENKTGFGLGLSIAQQIIEEHGGRISVKNLSPIGVSFQIIIPISTK